jgi:cell division protein FtsB
MNSEREPDADETPLPSRARRRVSAEETRVRRRTLIVGALGVALFMLLVNAVVGENGYLATLASRREQRALEARVAALRLDNQHLQQQSRRLLTDPSALEATARQELGLLKHGETLLIIRDSARDSAREPARNRAHDATPPPAAR